MNSDDAARQRLACVGDASRFRLVAVLATGERCVTDLALAVGLSQSCTTRHLQALQAAGLVRRVRHGKRVMVALRRDEPELRPLFDYVLTLAARRGAVTASPRRAGKVPRRPAAGRTKAGPGVAGTGGAARDRVRAAPAAGRPAARSRPIARTRQAPPDPRAATPPAGPIPAEPAPTPALEREPGPAGEAADSHRFDPLEDYLL